MKSLIYLLILILIVLSGCYGSRQGVVQKKDQSFIKFSGNATNVQVEIDGGKKFTLAEPRSKNEDSLSPRELYQISPGKHTVKIFRDGTLIVDRVIYLGNGETKEMLIP